MGEGNQINKGLWICWYVFNVSPTNRLPDNKKSHLKNERKAYDMYITTLHKRQTILYDQILTW